ncbi:methyltransferase domain-containing protein [Sphingomonas sp. BIUV-7]|uniref:Methyltransferase domain-containing protein n=1 Tax=Sphingomonas natans TaxID=3063330 RepID=A0ABT8YG66_9SPHN|nr:methyltransferase domain-containing protein [Sphingomonas sp. BIUV-7]MDO6416894.1 methyltransferase domain-containing protein [Sphingomonas sp. BIUV-7]
MILPRASSSLHAVADHYDELDPLYRDLWGEDLHHGMWRTGRESTLEAVTALSDLVGRTLDVAPGDGLVDIGCGYGATTRRFAAAGAIVTGLSVSETQIARAAPRESVTLRVEDWLENSLPDASFDGAYAIESSEHMADKPAFFAQAARVLKPGGRLVVCAWLANDPVPRWQVEHLLRPICEEGRLPSMATAAEYEVMAKQAGFSVRSYADISGSVAKTWTICLGRFLRAFVTRADVRRIALSGRNRDFALSLPRLILAYRTGAMRYGVFRFDLPSAPGT